MVLVQENDKMTNVLLSLPIASPFSPGQNRPKQASPQIIPGRNRLKLITLDAVPPIIMYLIGCGPSSVSCLEV